MNRARHNNEQQIDTALRLLGSARPSAHLQPRLLACIAAAQVNVASSCGARRFFHLPKVAFAAAAAVLASAVIVAGSVEHSRRIILPTAGIQLAPSGDGLGTASAAHLAVQPIKVENNSRGRSRRRIDRGRASLTKHLPKPAGVAVPDSPDLQR